MRNNFFIKISASLILTTCFAVLPTNNASARDKHQPASSAVIQKVIEQAYDKYKPVMDGKNASYIPYLAKADGKLYGIAIVTVDGRVFRIGDAGHPFPVESVSKIFTLADVLHKQGAENVLHKIGVNATGLPFNSALAVELNNDKLGGSPPPGNRWLMRGPWQQPVWSKVKRWMQNGRAL